MGNSKATNTNPTNASIGDLPKSLIFLIGATPIFMAIAPLSFSTSPEGWQVFLRGHSFILWPVELLAVLLLMRGGSSVVRGWHALPNFFKLAVLTLTALSVYTSFQPSKDHLMATIAFFRIGLIGLLALSLLGRDDLGGDDWRRLWWALGVGATAYIGLMVLFIATNSVEGRQWVVAWPGFNNIRHIAFLGLIAFAGGMAFVVMSEKLSSDRYHVTAVAIPAVSGLALVLWTGSRGPLLAIFFFTLCCFALFPKSRRAILAYAGISFAFGIAIASALPIPHPIYGVLQAFGISDVGSSDLNQASSGRLEVWRTALAAILERPILGWGLNQFTHLPLSTKESFYHPHNYPLQLLYSSGIVGALLVLAATASLVFNRMPTIWSVPRKFSAVMIVTLLFYSLYDGILYFNYPLLVFTLAFIGFLQGQPGPDRSD